MKRVLFLLAALLQIGVASADWYDGTEADPLSAADDGGLFFEEAPGVDPVFSTPGTNTAVSGKSRAFVPNNFYFEYFGNFSLSSQSAHVQAFNVYLGVPLNNPARPLLWGWHLDTTASLRATWIETKGVPVLDVHRLYTLGLQAGLSHMMGRHAQVQFGGVGQLSSDFNVSSEDNFYIGCYGALSFLPNDNLHATVGVAFMPDFYEHYVFPMLSLAWRYSPMWELNIQASRVSVLNVANDKCHWGPFAQWNSARWTVLRDRRTEQFRMTNFIAGLGATFDVATPTGAKVSLLGDFGTSFYNTFRVRDKKGRHSLEKYRGRPGLYVRVGAQVQF